LSEPFDGILADEHDNRNIMAVLGPKFGAMKDKQFDVVMIPQHEPCPIGEWDENDTKLPKGVEPYFLKADSGPTWLLGGILSRPFITTTQNGGQFAISSIESSSAYGQSALSQLMRFDKVHHAFMVVNGTLKLRLDGIEHEISADETAFVPAGQAFALSFASKYTRVWSFASGDGVETLIHQAGHEYDGKILPAKAAVVDRSRLEASAASIAVTLVDKA
jgi:mannose-6-phosphate isomerase-like protein (cupin superfamily)